MDAQGHLRLMESAMEEWRPVVGYEGLYEVSSEGRVRSLGREGVSVRGVRYKKRPKILVQPIDGKGYPRVSLYNENGELRSSLVFRLVASAFIGPLPYGMETRHLDGNRANSRLENLRYGTRQENMRDRDAHGNTRKGVGSGNAKLNDDAVRDIRQKRISQSSYARLYGVTQSTVSKVQLGNSWVHLQ